MKRSKTMKTASLDSHIPKLVLAEALVILVFAWTANAQTSSTAQARHFSTAEQAADALIDAAEKYDEATLTEILGPDSYDILHTGEPARDREVAKEFAAQARVKTNVAVQKGNTRRAFLSIGD